MSKIDDPNATFTTEELFSFARYYAKKHGKKGTPGLINVDLLNWERDREYEKSKAEPYH